MPAAEKRNWRAQAIRLGFPRKEPVVFTGCDYSRQSRKVSDCSPESPDSCSLSCMEPFAVRRMSCRTVQLPPLAFRQAEQYYCERKPETETAQPRPTSLPLRTPPLIAITSADTSR
ncbi:cAMP-specific 3',5'-cyclic phosphodiesterase 4D [Labeo rohita]|uniref:cAMP-specific 3',5'-cyclic phosphodiesterase 4D n=1 Tax=Labeo rohita TaxID=84645 RepID=A0ABQ8MGF8_LABRO|nr:cAMP-specific 3',5'-cyclic phosphodiesterase 4D [Labeo rohita]